MKINRGVKQGGPLSPFLFSIYIDELSGRLDKDEAGIIVGNMKINNILYADDLILICNNVFEMNRMLEITENYGKEYEIKFNPNKTNYIIFFDKQLSNQKEFIIDIQPVFQGEVVKRVEAIKYLGVWLDEQINFKIQLKKRKRLFTYSYQQMKKCGIMCDLISTEIKLCYYKTYIRPCLYYGLDNLNINETQIKSLQILESTLIKGMFLINKMRRSTPLLRAYNINIVKENKNRTKVLFSDRLLQFNSTKNLIIELDKNDKQIYDDKKSLFYDLTKITEKKDLNF